MDAETILQWKKEYGHIYSADIGFEVVFRPLTFAEYDEVVFLEQNEGSAAAEDLLVQTALLHPSDFEVDNQPAGLVSSLAEEIISASGLGDVKRAEQMLEEHRKKTEQVRFLMKAFVLATMPAYKEEDLDALTFYALAGKVAMAEQIIRVNQAAFGVDNEMKLALIDPEEEAERERVQAEKHAAQKKPGQAGYHDPVAQKLHEAMRGT